MTDQKTSRIQKISDAFVAFQACYLDFIETVKKTAESRQHDILALSKATGVKKSEITQFLEHRKVMITGIICTLLAEYAEIPDRIGRLKELTDAFDGSLGLIGLAILPKETVLAAFDIHEMRQTYRKNISREEFAGIFPLPEIIVGVLTFRRESIALLVGEYAEQVNAFLCSSEESGFSQKIEKMVQTNNEQNRTQGRLAIKESPEVLARIDEYDKLLTRVVAKFGSKKKASDTIGIKYNYFTVSEFKKGSKQKQLQLLEQMRTALESNVPLELQQQSEKKEGEPTTKSAIKEKQVNNHFQLPDYQPGQVGIDFAVKMLRLSADILMSFSMMSDHSQRNAVRAAIEPDAAILLQALRIHASEHPAEVAKILGGEALLRKLGITKQTETEGTK